MRTEFLSDNLPKYTTVEQIDAELTRLEQKPTGSHAERAGFLIKIYGLCRQADVAKLLINVTRGMIDSADLTSILAGTFPDAKIGERHGPHYLSLARSGKLDGVLPGITIPMTSRRAKKAAATPVVASATPVVAAGDTVRVVQAIGAADIGTAESILGLNTAQETISMLDGGEVPPITDQTIIGTVIETTTPVSDVDRLKALDHPALMAEAKRLGVSAKGKKGDIIARIMAAL